MGWGNHKRGIVTKYRAQKVSHEGRNFASKLEASVFDLLTILHRGKEIRCQFHVKLSRAKILYIADFAILGGEGQPKLLCEAKGFVQPTWAIKKRLYEFYGEVPLEIYGGTYQKPYLVETIVPKKD